MTNTPIPPANRTHLGLEMTEAITPNTLHLQRCEQCNTVQHPPREVCMECLSQNLPWCEVNQAGTVLASSKLHHCLEPYFSARKPWLMGSIKLDCGPVVLAHLAEDVSGAGSRVWVVSLKDESEQGVLAAVSQSVALDQATAHAQLLTMRESPEKS